LNQIHRETRKKLRQQEQASKKISHQKNDKVHISILSIEKTKKKMKITSLLLHIMYIKDLQDKCD
jgi:hypothetical protein